MLFKRKKEIEQYQATDECTSIDTVHKNEVEVIEVRDIKQYLVNEYDYVHKLEDEIKILKGQLELGEETKIKYDAALVTLDEFDNRIKSKDKTICELNDKIKSLKEENKNNVDEKNTLKIKLNHLGRTKEEIEDKLNSKYEDNLKERVNFNLGIIRNVFMNKKGALTKSYVKEIIEKEMGERE